MVCIEHVMIAMTVIVFSPTTYLGTGFDEVMSEFTHCLSD